MKRRMLILTPIALGLLCMIIVGLACAKKTVIYDLNDDDKVDIQDLACVAAAFGSQVGDPQWDPVPDLDGNGKVNIIDIGLVAGQFGLALHTPPAKGPPFETPPRPPFETPPVTAPP